MIAALFLAGLGLGAAVIALAPGTPETVTREIPAQEAATILAAPDPAPAPLLEQSPAAVSPDLPAEITPTPTSTAPPETPRPPIPTAEAPTAQPPTAETAPAPITTGPLPRPRPRPATATDTATGTIPASPRPEPRISLRYPADIPTRAADETAATRTSGTHSFHLLGADQLALATALGSPTTARALATVPPALPPAPAPTTTPKRAAASAPSVTPPERILEILQARRAN